MSLKDGKTEIVSHKIYCPSCGQGTGVTIIVNLLGTEGIIKCLCTKTFAYKIKTTYEILTATVNEFEDHQL